MESQNRFLDSFAHMALKTLGKIDRIYREQKISSFFSSCGNRNPFLINSRLENLEKKVETLEKKQTFSKEKERDI